MLDILTTWICSSRKHLEMTINGHKVVWSYQPHGRVQYDWTCDCKGFQFRKTCKHVVEAQKNRCSWNEALDFVEKPSNGRCPECGSDVESIRIGV